MANNLHRLQVCGGSALACGHLLRELLPRLLALLPPPPSPSSGVGSTAALAAAAPAAVPSTQWGSTRTLHCLAVLRGIVAGAAASLSCVAAGTEGVRLAPEQRQQQQQHQQQQQRLGAGYVVAAFTPAVVEQLVTTLGNALHAVAPSCLGGW